ncbi:hypothetical protein GY45DRAFT_1376073 [Cubamyces sp. BRFM 1775]|nr:hypothetical protein GY45DRAFT_1376073 [Cubamyces sp. BRFM 1775]
MPYPSRLSSQERAWTPFSSDDDGEEDIQWDEDEQDRALRGAMEVLGRDAFEAPSSEGSAPAFDGASVPPTLDADDAMVQSAIHASVMNVTQPSPTDDAYNDMQARDLSLSTLRRMYDLDDEKGALSVLRKKHRLKINCDYQVDPEDKDLLWHIAEHRLDYMTRVPKDMGFGAVLPNVQHPRAGGLVGWNFKMTFTRRYWSYKGDIDVLAYNPRGSMLCIGDTDANENVWLCYMPEQALEAFPSPDLMTAGNGPTVMDPVLCRVTIAMLLFMMTKSGYRDIHVKYPPVATEAVFKQATDILTRNNWEFSVEELQALQDTLDEWYPWWWDNAPEEYKDAIPPGRVPVAVVVKYGQNRKICIDTSKRLDAESWSLQWDFSKLSRVAMAIATHYGATPVASWEERGVDDILARDEVLYTTSDVATREAIESLDEYDLLDADGVEIPIFNAEGRRIPRRLAIFDEPYTPCGILQDLSKVPSLFETGSGDIDATTFEIETSESGRAILAEEVQVAGLICPHDTPTYYLYPLFYSQNVGQWQASGIIAPLSSHVTKLNHDIAQHDHHASAVVPVKSQCYNTLSHYTRESARDHIAQRGILTGAAGGSWADDNKTTNTATYLRGTCDQRDPHEHLADQVSRADDTHLRLENVYLFHMQRMAPKYRDGAQFYESVVFPLAQACRQPNVLASIKATSIVFKPDIWPHAMLWAMYPMNVLLKQIWHNHIRPTLGEHPDKHPDHVYVELLAVSERLINYGHTGSMRVLTTGLMRRLWPSRAIVDTGFPAFAPALSFGGENSTLPVMNIEKWPIDLETGRPLYATKRAMELTYGKAHFLKYITLFDIRIKAATTTPQMAFSADPYAPRIIIMADIVIDAFVKDVLAFVREELDTEISGLLKDRAHDDHKWAVRRQKSYKAWKTSSHPLDYGEGKNTLGDLVHLVSSSQEDIRVGLPHSAAHSISLEDFVDRILKWAASGVKKPRAPLWSNGACAYILRTVLAEVKRFLRDHTPQERDVEFRRALVGRLVAHKVRFIPDAPVSPSGVGAPSHRLSLHAWTKLGATPSALVLGTQNALSHAERLQIELQASASQAEVNDCRASWTALTSMIEDFLPLLARRVLPSDWSIERVRNHAKPFILEVYNWGHSRFLHDQQHWTCQLALVLAFFLTKVTPCVFFPSDIPETVRRNIVNASPRSPRLCISSVRELDWVESKSQGKKGFSEKNLYFTQAALVILAWIDPSSPLRVELAKPSGDIRLWNTKHGAFLNFSLIHYLIAILF